MAEIRTDMHRDAESPIWLSILIPVYNVEPYLHECVYSIINQQPDRGVEIILLDDCSQDGSWQICVELAAKFPHLIRLLRHEQNSGLSAARNSMLDAAHGDYVWFLDSDDYLIDTSLQQLKGILSKGSPDVIMCDYRKRRSLFKKSFPGFRGHSGTDKQKLLAGVFEYRKMYAWLKISKRTLWADDLRFPMGRAFEDIATIPSLLLRCESFHYVPRAWVYYRIRPNSIMSSVTRTRNYFDIGKNDDLASALIGFPEQLAMQTDDGDLSATFFASHFIASEYCKLAKRFVDAAGNMSACKTGEHAPMLSSYLGKMEDGSPLKFDDLRRAYLKRLRLWDYAKLSRAVAMAQNAA